MSGLDFISGAAFTMGLVFWSFGCCMIGLRWGKETAVDLTKSEGHFCAYGKKYKAEEIK